MDPNLLDLQEIWMIFIAPFFYWQMATAFAFGVVIAVLRVVGFWKRALPVRIVSNDA